MDPRETVFVTADALGRRMQSGEAFSILAVRNAGPEALPGFATAPRLPGAVDIDLASELAAPGGGTRGSRPLPEIGALQRDARRWGLRRDVPVVLYDHDRCLTAARGWWVLRWAGLAQVLLLDGGFAAWRAAGLPVATVPGAPAASDVVLSAGHMPVLDAEATAAMPRAGRAARYAHPRQLHRRCGRAGAAATRAYPGLAQRAGGRCADRGRHIPRRRDAAAPVRRTRRGRHAAGGRDLRRRRLGGAWRGGTGLDRHRGGDVSRLLVRLERGPGAVGGHRPATLLKPVPTACRLAPRAEPCRAAPDQGSNQATTSTGTASR